MTASPTIWRAPSARLAKTLFCRGVPLLVLQVQYLWDEGLDLAIFKNDEKTCDEIRAMNPRGILISPGPGELLVCFRAKGG